MAKSEGEIIALSIKRKQGIIISNVPVIVRREEGKLADATIVIVIIVAVGRGEGKGCGEL